MQFHLQFENDLTLTEERFVEYKIIIHPDEKLEEMSQQISLASFQIDSERESILVKNLDKFSSTLTPFKIPAGSSGFSVSVAALHTQLNIVLKIDVHVPKKYLTKTFVTRMDKNYNADFPVEKLVLLKRNPENAFEICKEFYFF